MGKRRLLIMEGRRALRLLFILGLAVSGPAPAGQDQPLDLPTLLDKIAGRMQSHAKNESWTLSVISTITRMDKSWKPEKVTVIDKKLRIDRGESSEEIISVTETEDGVMKDVTQKYRRESAERRAKEKREQEERRRKGTTDNRRLRQGLELKEEDFLPFSAKNRPFYEFSFLPETSLDDKPVYKVAARSKVKEENYFEGHYYVSRDTFDVLRAEVRPSKNPHLVKELEMTIDFVLLPGDHYVLKSSRIKLYAGFFLKHVRMVVEDQYSDYQVLSQG